MSVKTIESKNGVTRLQALSTDVIRVGYSDLGTDEIYINNKLGTWDDNNPKEEGGSTTVVAENYSLTEANAEMNKIRKTTDVKYFE